MDKKISSNSTSQGPQVKKIGRDSEPKVETKDISIEGNSNDQIEAAIIIPPEKESNIASLLLLILFFIK